MGGRGRAGTRIETEKGVLTKPKCTYMYTCMLHDYDVHVHTDYSMNS